MIILDRSWILEDLERKPYRGARKRELEALYLLGATVSGGHTSLGRPACARGAISGGRGSRPGRSGNIWMRSLICGGV